MSSTIVTIYTSATCGPCVATKRALERAGIAFREVPIESLCAEQIEAFKAEGLTQAPIVIAPDGQAWSAHRPDRIKAL